MAHKLADELLKEILAPPLLVPDELFADTGPISPFSKATYSAADVLLVCKRWMRIATPALYHTVVIRSTAQANALAAALKRNPDFGKYIKKLRLEGAYGDKLKILATTSADIPDFCMSLAIWADSGITGLTKIMSTTNLNPRRVILTTAVSSSGNFGNKKHTEVLDKLCYCISSWTNLETFYFSGSSVVSSPEVGRHFRLADALSKSTSLRVIHIWLDRWPGSTTWDLPCRRFFETLASNDSFQRLYVHAVGSYGDLASEIPAYLNSRAVVLPPNTAEPGAAASAHTDDHFDHNPFYIPMANAPIATRREIWSQILSFAIASRTAPGIQPYNWAWYDGEYFDLETAKSLILTSHAFAATVIPLLFRHLAPQTSIAVATILHYTEAYGVLGSQVYSFSSARLLHPDTTQLIRSLTQLRVCAVPALATMLRAVESAAGATLQRLVLKPSMQTTINPAGKASLFSFTALTSLFADYSTVFDIGSADIPPDAALANLCTLEIRDTRLLDILEPFSLPNIAHFICDETNCKLAGSERFLARHGSKLKTFKVQLTTGVDLDSCSSLETLEICEKWGKNLPVPFPEGHPVLRQLKLHWYPNLRSGRPKRHWTLLFQHLTRTLFPSLQEVHLLHDPGTDEAGIWPTTEHDIKKSVWLKYAETLATEGITLFDHTGRSWRPAWQPIDDCSHFTPSPYSICLQRSDSCCSVPVVREYPVRLSIV